MTVNEIINTIKSLNRNKGAFYGFETLTEVGLNKCPNGDRKGVKRDFTLYVHRTFSAMVGINYENAMNNFRERNGLERDFVAQKPFGMHHIEGEEGAYILQGDRNCDQYYIALDRIGNQTAKYFINGEEVSGERLKEIFAKFGKPQKEEKEPITWRHYKVEGILKIK
jgi:hypothetical protein